MPERKEALMRILVGIISGIIWAFWGFLMRVIVIIHFLYVLFANKRNKDKYSAYNHGLAVFNSRERTDLLKKIIAPTFIYHGEKDPCFPIEHGKLLYKLINNSKFNIVKNMGHMFSLTESNYLLEEIVKNISEFK